MSRPIAASGNMNYLSGKRRRPACAGGRGAAMSAEVPAAPTAFPAATRAAGRTQTAGERCLMTISSAPGGERIMIGMRGEVDHAARQPVRDNLVKALDASRQGLDLDLARV